LLHVCLAVRGIDDDRKRKKRKTNQKEIDW
jgi:hypothetical protein